MNILQSNTDVIAVKKMTKIFRLYNRPLDRLKEAFTLKRNKFYHQPFYALDGVSFTIEKGDTVGIVGRNGSGKSTLLQLICGILKPTSGYISVIGRISALLELGAGFNPEFTGRENVYLNGAILGVSKKEMSDCFDDIESFADIGSFIDQPVKTYSSGMYVRLAFAVAINVNPDILIVDEALSVGDSLFQAKCFAKFREFQEKGVTILFVTHSMDLITRYCQKALLLEKGKIINFGSAKDIVDEYNRMIVGYAETSEMAEDNDANLSKQIAGHMQESCVAFQRNSKENRYGNGDAEIIDIGINSLSNIGRHSFLHGEKYRFWIKIKFSKEINDPIFAYTIKDVKGFDITGTNTYFQDIETGTVKSGEIILVEFDQRMMLNAGSYIMSFGCAGFKEGKYVVYDRRYDMISFEVVSSRESIGMFDLNSKISIQKVQ